MLPPLPYIASGASGYIAMPLLLLRSYIAMPLDAYRDCYNLFINKTVFKKPKVTSFVAFPKIVLVNNRYISRY
jgi:hypothetical protein